MLEILLDLFVVFAYAFIFASTFHEIDYKKDRTRWFLSILVILPTSLYVVLYHGFMMGETLRGLVQ